MAIRQDVRRVEQLPTPEAAYRTLRLIRSQDAFAKCSLVKSTQCDHSHVCSPSLRDHRFFSRTRDEGTVGLVDGNGEGEIARVVPDHVDRPGRHVASRDNAVKVHERNPALHGETQADIVTVVRIGPTVSIEDDVRPHLILVGTRATLNDWRRVDAERHVRQDRGLENTLRPNEGNPVSFEVKPSLEHLVGQRVRMEDRLLREELKGREPDATVEVGHISLPGSA